MKVRERGDKAAAKWVHLARVYEIVDDSGWVLGVIELAPEVVEIEKDWPHIGDDKKVKSIADRSVVTATIQADIDAIGEAIKRVAV